MGRGAYFGFHRAVFPLLCVFSILTRTTRGALVVWYMMNETAGSTVVKDYSGNGYSGTAVNGPLFNKAYMNLSSTSSQYVEFPAAAISAVSSLGSFSVTVWVYQKTIVQYSRVFEFWKDSANYMRFSPYHNSGHVVYGAYLSGAQTSVETSTVTAAATWYHLGIAYDMPTDTVTMYINGASAALATGSTINSAPSEIAPLVYGYIGKSAGSVAYLNACLYDLRIYDLALGAIDFFRIYQTKTTAPTTAPTSAPTAPTVTPTRMPTGMPTKVPTQAPTQLPTVAPTMQPTGMPTRAPTLRPTVIPTVSPSIAPTVAPPTVSPSLSPTMAPTMTPTQVPTAPTKSPTQRPTTFPTQAPTAFAASLSLVSAASTRSSAAGSSIVRVVNPTQALTLMATSTSASNNNTWSSPNATLNAAIGSATSSPFYLWLPAGSLVATSTSSLFIFRWKTITGTGTHTAQLSVLLNRAPTNGSVRASPLIGTSLRTNFTIRSRWWTDPDADLPLAYAYTADTVLLAQATSAKTIWSYLPPSQNLSLVLQVRDALGAYTTARSSARIVVKVATLANTTALLTTHTATVLTKTNSTTFTRELAVAAMASTVIRNRTTATNGNFTVHARTSLLGLMSTLLSSYPNEAITVPMTATAAAAINDVTALPAGVLLSDALQLKAVDTLSSFMSRMDTSYFSSSSTTTSSSSSVGLLGSSVVSGLSNLINAGVLTSPLCRTRLPSKAIDTILQRLSAVAADSLNPGGQSLSYVASSIGVHVGRYSYRQLPDSQSYNITFTSRTSSSKDDVHDNVTMVLPASVLWQVGSQLCADGVVAVHAVNWGVDKHACYNTSTNTTTRSNISTSRYSAITPRVGTFDLLRSCINKTEASSVAADRVLTVRRTTVPVTIRLPLAPTAASASSSSGGGVGGECVFWNSSTYAWSSQGCRRAKTTRDSDGKVSCLCNHLSDFSVIPDTVDFVISTTQDYHKIVESGVARRHLGLLVVLGVLYAAFFVSMVAVRWRRTRESWEYMKRIPQTRMYKAVLSLILKQQELRDLGHYHHQHQSGNTTTNPSQREGQQDPSSERNVIQDALRLLPEHSMDDVAATAKTIRARRLKRLRTLGLPVQEGSNGWCCPAGWWWRVGNNKAANRVYGEVEGETAETDLLQRPVDGKGSFARLTESLTLPLNQLTTQQVLIIAFIKILTQLTIALILVGPDPTPIMEFYRAFVGLRLFSRAMLLSLLWQNLLQSILSEPFLRAVEFMLLVVNKETSVKMCVGEDIVNRDLELFVPTITERNALGSLFVPMMRIGIIQLELALAYLRDPQYRGTLQATNVLAPNVRARYIVTLSREIRRLRYILKEEYESQSQEERQVVEERLVGVQGCTENIVLRLSTPLVYFRRRPDFMQNPIEPIDLETKVSRVYDEWMSEEVLVRSLLARLARPYYRIFLAEVHNHVVGQEFFLFSWRLALCDAILAMYVLALTFFLLLLSLDVRIETVVYALSNMAGGLAVNVIITAPLLTRLQSTLTYHIMDTIKRALLEQHQYFEAYYRQQDDPASVKARQLTMLQTQSMSKTSARSKAEVAPFAANNSAGDGLDDEDGDGGGRGMWAGEILGGRGSFADLQEDDDDQQQGQAGGDKRGGGGQAAVARAASEKKGVGMMMVAAALKGDGASSPSSPPPQQPSSEQAGLGKKRRNRQSSPVRGDTGGGGEDYDNSNSSTSRVGISGSTTTTTTSLGGEITTSSLRPGSGVRRQPGSRSSPTFSQEPPPPLAIVNLATAMPAGAGGSTSRGGGDTNPRRRSRLNRDQQEGGGGGTSPSSSPPPGATTSRARWGFDEIEDDDEGGRTRKPSHRRRRSGHAKDATSSGGSSDGDDQDVDVIDGGDGEVKLISGFKSF